ncbi:MAG: cell division protein FtsZ, partial [Alphaproteobacteria bacterium]
FVVANTDAQALAMSSAERHIQMGTAITDGLGAGSQPQIGAAAAEETMPEILDHVSGAHMVFITAGMGGGTGTGAAPVIARLAREQNILTIGVVTKPFQFEGARRMTIAEAGIEELQKFVDTLIVIPNQNLFRVANERTTFADAFAMADQVLYSGVAGITDLMVKEGLINLDFADVRSIMSGMGKAMMGTGEASGEKRATEAAEAAIANPLLDDVSMKGARGLLISITGGEDLTLYEVDEAATRIRAEVDPEANIILGATFDSALEGYIRVSVVATGIDGEMLEQVDEPGFVSLSDIANGGLTPALAPAAEPLDFATTATGSLAPSPQHEVSPEPEASPHPGAPTHPGVLLANLNQDIPAVNEPPASVDDFAVAEPDTALDAGPAQADQPFIPPEAVIPAPAVPRMPRIEELPMVAQREIEAQAREAGEHGIEAQKHKTGFLERLAKVGLGRRDALPRKSEPKLEAGDAPVSSDHPLHRVQNGGGIVRPAGPANDQPSDAGQIDEEQLEIPAFLRRQAR